MCVTSPPDTRGNVFQLLHRAADNVVSQRPLLVAGPTATRCTLQKKIKKFGENRKKKIQNNEASGKIRKILQMFQEKVNDASAE